MAIQLNDRDHLIFKLIDEHQVLLEKHISWFISGDDKPVLIRDRLRKLFYLDYLLCHRYGTKLPWWTTPTKPLVYLLSPMARTISGLAPAESDLFDTDVQRHFLEIANIRMIHLIARKDEQITQLNWLTLKSSQDTKQILNAKVSFIRNGTTYKVAIVNHPALASDLIDNLSCAQNDNDADRVLIISRDEAHQLSLQKLIIASNIASFCCFTTHHDLYRLGIINSTWQTAQQKRIDLFAASAESPQWAGGFGMQAISGAVA
jgi:hypothetical protein